jgi:phage gp36-like protein
MAYVTRAQIETEIPASYLVAALDDNRDGEEDEGLFDAKAAKASGAVDAILGSRFDVPFEDPVPASAAEAAYVFLGEIIYSAREVAENPFTKRAAFWRARLAEIANGKASLDGVTTSVVGHGAAITDNSVIDDSTR